jgi:succinate dehydrogenase/fumarate reductase iron-sulfur protein
VIHQYDTVVIGGGIAGLCTALITAQTNCRGAVVSKVRVMRSHSVAAQGGIAASLGNEEEDFWQWHMYDTIKGSDYLADQDAVEILTKEAPEVIYSLEHLGVLFTRNTAGKNEQRKFGGHTRNQGDFLGKNPEKENLQTPQELEVFDDAIKCILCGCCFSACPVMTEQDQDFIGPASILRAYRHIFDSRTKDAEERIEILKKPHGIWGCKSYYMCSVVCPKKIKVTQSILKTKKKIIFDKQLKSEQ